MDAVKLFEQNGEDIFVKGLRRGRSFHDILFTIGMSLFESLLLKKTLRDINAQPTMFSRPFFNSWESPPQDFSLDLYAYYQAKIQKKDIYRIPVFFSPRLFGKSHWNLNWREKFKFIKRTIRYSFKLKKQLKKL
jgi:hypothetical protein